MSFPAVKAFTACFAYVAAHWRTLLKILWLPSLILFAGAAFVTPNVLDAQLALPDENADSPAEAFSAGLDMLKWNALLYLVIAIAQPMMAAGVLKHVVRGETPSRPFYLSYGGDEARLLAAMILLAVMTGVVYLVGFLAVLVLGFAFGVVSPALGATAALIASLACLALGVWFALRLSLVFPASIDARTVGVAETWLRTKGAVLPLLLFWLLWALVLIPVAVTFSFAMAPGLPGLYMEMIASGADPAAQEEIGRRLLETQREMWTPSNPQFIRVAIVTVLYNIVWNGLWTVASGVAYRYLSPPDGAR